MAMLATVMVVATAAEAFCCMATRRRDVAVGSAMAVMMLAMIDTGWLGDRLLPAYGWSILLLLVAAGVGVSGRGCPRSVDRVAHLVAMAVLTALMGWRGSGDGIGRPVASGMPGMTGIHDMSGMSGIPAVGGAQWMTLFALVLALAFVVFLGARTDPDASPPLLVYERTTSAVSVLAMTAMVAVM